MAVTQLLHAALLVQNLARSRQFYEAILGLTPIVRPFGFPGIWYQMDAQQLHLIESSEILTDQVNTDKLGRNRHLALGVQNLEEIIHILESSGFSAQKSASGRSAIFTQDPDGNIIELMELT